MIFIIWSDYDGREIEKFGEGIDEVALAEARLLELMNLERDPDDNGTSIDMVIKGGTEVQYEVVEVASAIKIKNE